MNLKSYILLEVTVILEMIKMEITTDSRYCTSTLDDFQQCRSKKLKNFKSNILIWMKAISVKVIMEMTAENIHHQYFLFVE